MRTPGRREAASAVKALRSELLRRTADAALRAPSVLRQRLDVPDTGAVAVAPSEDQLRRWAVAVGLDYQAWCMHRGFVTLAEWWRQRDEVAAGPARPAVISILTPVHDTPVEFLREAVYSVMVQSDPHWELCIVDDASSAPDTLAELDRLRTLDPRIRIERSDTNLGICDATNRALAMANGSYVAFLDHDDRLAPDAIFHVTRAIAAEPGLDLVYSDRDLLDTDNYRTAPTFKPGWAPETLLGGNYMFHLMVYRRSLVERLGGYRREFEGSQDLDLVLRAVETSPYVRHIPRVLYHWRQHEGSMALLPEHKPHIFATGKAAVAAALERRGIDGTVEEIPDIWRGHYRVELPSAAASRTVVRVEDPDSYRDVVAAALADSTAEHFVVLGADVAETDPETIDELCAWLGMPGVVATCGRVISDGGWLRHAGLVRRPDAAPMAVWSGYDMADPGYLASTVSIRNVSLVHPLVCAWRTDVLRSVGGVDGPYGSPYAMIDAAVRADIERLRFVYDPLATFRSMGPGIDPDSWNGEDRDRFLAERHDVLTIDGHFNLNLDRDQVDYRIALGAPLYPEDWRGARSGYPESPGLSGS